jgi:hypothetical protein
VQIFELFVGDAELDAAEWVRLDEVNEFPANGALRKPCLEFANHGGGSETLKEAAYSARKPDVNLGNAEFDVTVGAKLGEVDVVDADDLAASGVDDLLIEEILLNGEPGFVGLVGVEGALVDGEIDAAGGNFGDLVVTSDERLEASARDEEVGNAIGLVSGFDKEFTDATNEIVLRVVGSGAH